MQQSREIFLRFSKSSSLNSCKGFIQIFNWVPLRVCRSVIPACCYSSQPKIIAFVFAVLGRETMQPSQFSPLAATVGSLKRKPIIPVNMGFVFTDL